MMTQSFLALFYGEKVRAAMPVCGHRDRITLIFQKMKKVFLSHARKCHPQLTMKKIKNLLT